MLQHLRAFVVNYKLCTPIFFFFANTEKLAREIWSNDFFAEKSLQPTILVKCRWELGEETVERWIKTLGIHVKMFKGLWESRFLLFKQKCWWWSQKKSIHILWNEPTLTLAASRKTGLLRGFWESAHFFQVLTLLHHFYRTIKFLRNSMVECVVKKYTCLRKIDL